LGCTIREAGWGNSPAYLLCITATFNVVTTMPALDRALHHAKHDANWPVSVCHIVSDNCSSSMQPLRLRHWLLGSIWLRQ
jgi:hypothetical protein